MSYEFSGLRHNQFGADVATATCDYCYTVKSDAYQNCQSLPPEDRVGRDACFQGADKSFAGCLKDCGAPSASSGSLGTLALVGAGLALLALR